MMKRILALLAAAMLLASCAACTKQPNNGNGGDGDVINPMVAYNTIEEINGVCGTRLFEPALLSVSDTKYFVIGGDLADYRFTWDGIAFTCRASKRTEDISGIWAGGETVFANDELSERPSVYEGDGFVTMRWLAEGVQYVMTAEAADVTYERVRDVLNVLAAATIPNGTDYVLLEGNYAAGDDDDAAMYVGTLGSSVYVMINRLLSPTETVNWSMTARFDSAGHLVYEDGVKRTGRIGGDNVYTETVVSEHERGWFTLERGDDALLKEAVLRWEGAPDGECRGLAFVRVPDDEQ